ncbi:hypothetical protein NB311A_04429 [Nitrobacter sp. Nb-311A]|uniref:VapE domain-containing protein n=1 Tax=Nitrobacter sp. Nb-311A TaxID=314253 RepID=UPI000068638B|nr:VapE domain-containing protein [Nitrobacter sp. Nb-311A]EAQ37527.1 hypothetical protein NB311A_04429 [Nitrobacter sp. Nb-311A]
MHDIERAERVTSNVALDISTISQYEVVGLSNRTTPSTANDFHSAPTDEVVDESNVESFVRDYMARRQIEVLFDGTLFLRDRPLQAITAEDIDAVLAVDPPNTNDLLDEIVLFARGRGARFKKGDLSAALRQVLRTERRRRYQIVMRPLLENCSLEAYERARESWNRLGTLFDMERELAVAILKHFCWCVKQKQLGRTVLHHCFPIVFSAEQGTGKTVFVKKFISPLRELATEAALFSDLSDRRSGDIFRFPVIFLDDMEEVRTREGPALKSVLTADKLRRRRMGTSFSDGIRQSSVPIGTSNRPIHELVQDSTGHRRFAMMPFRNGAVTKGGDAEVWHVVNSTDYELLWQSVDAFAPSPILPYLRQLRDHQGASRSRDSVLDWVRELDFESEPVRNLTTKRGLRAQALHALFMVQTGTEISAKCFADEMHRVSLQPDTPFADKIKTETGALYRLKRPQDDGRHCCSPRSHPPTSSLSSLSGPSASSGPSSSLSVDEAIGQP